MATQNARLSAAKTAQMDADSTAMIYEGASVSQLVYIFGQDHRKIKARLAGLHPVGTRAGYPVYSIKEAARYLVEPMWDMDEFIRRMKSASDLPPLVRKELWAGLRSQQLFEIDNNDLWRTDQVIEHISELLKSLAVPMRLASDTVNREARLSTTQRNIINQLMDDALSSCADYVRKVCEEAKRARDITELQATLADEVIDDDRSITELDPEDDDSEI